MKPPSSSWFGPDVVILENFDDQKIKVKEINANLVNKQANLVTNMEYKISSGDILTVLVWGQPEAFPSLSSYQPNNPQNARTVGTDGYIFFPYIGKVYVAGLTINQVRNNLTNLLSKDFINPQVDVTITRFNSKRNIYVVGEVSKPTNMVLGIEPISLSEALVRSGGLNPNTSDPKSVFVIRQPTQGIGPEIYRANMKSPEEFIASGQFYLKPRDIVYVGAADITQWNRVISQFFPFASLINQVDNISSE
tara:strand:+ start:4342 stop:5091 length:750 start_codon:yes stop_codon:yes gene_type:complete